MASFGSVPRRWISGPSQTPPLSESASRGSVLPWAGPGFVSAVDSSGCVTESGFRSEYRWASRSAAGTMAPPEAMVDARVVARRLASALAATVAGDVLAVRVASWVDDSGGAFTDVGRKRRAEPPPVAQVEVSAAETHPQTLCGMLCDYPVVRAPSSSAPGSASSVDYALYSAANVGVQFTVPLSVESACSLSLAAWTRRLAQAGVSCARTVGAEGCHVAL